MAKYNSRRKQMHTFAKKKRNVQLKKAILPRPVAKWRRRSASRRALVERRILEALIPPRARLELERAGFLNIRDECDAAIRTVDSELNRLVKQIDFSRPPREEVAHSLKFEIRRLHKAETLLEELKKLPTDMLSEETKAVLKDEIYYLDLDIQSAKKDIESLKELWDITV